jgi:hypothetical protein
MDNDSNKGADQEDINGDIESRMSLLENWKEQMQVTMVMRLMEQVCNRINLNPAQHIPKLGKLIIEVKDLGNQFERKFVDDKQYQKEKETLERSQYEIVQELKFNVNTMAADLHFMKSVFNNDKIKQMNT